MSRSTCAMCLKEAADCGCYGGPCLCVAGDGTNECPRMEDCQERAIARRFA